MQSIIILNNYRLYSIQMIVKERFDLNICQIININQRV